MAWEARNGRKYFYRSKRAGAKVEKVYLGCKDAAHKAAERDAAARRKRAAEETELAAEQAKLASVNQLAAEADHGVALITEAAPLAQGFHNHRGQWRRLRNG